MFWDHKVNAITQNKHNILYIFDMTYTNGQHAYKKYMTKFIYTHMDKHKNNGNKLSN